ncbi:hypothetical protein FJY94_08870 [Candidatus Kaiserbacteria bacterium]|nr:hypothetical protein [Candidatus Kaiserbacteria bacterium]
MTQVPESPSERTRAANALRDFAAKFQVPIETQIAVDECPGSIALGFVPQFGSPQGVLIDSIQPPSYEGDKALMNYAHCKGIFYSQVNAAQMANYAEADFIAMFRDWGYCGDSPPSWLSG